jgi:phospholipid-translocating ATPase
MLNFLIPITLNIVIEGVKTFSGLFLTFDRKLYDPTIKKECGVLNTSIIEELGVVDCVLTDKTGTLTANEMVFRKIAIRNTIVLRDEL